MHFPLIIEVMKKFWKRFEKLSVTKQRNTKLGLFCIQFLYYEHFPKYLFENFQSHRKTDQYNTTHRPRFITYLHFAVVVLFLYLYTCTLLLNHLKIHYTWWQFTPIMLQHASPENKAILYNNNMMIISKKVNFIV